MYVTKRPQHLDVAELRDTGGQPKRERVTQWEHDQTPECYKPRPSGTRMSPLRKETQEERRWGGRCPSRTVPSGTAPPRVTREHSLAPRERGWWPRRRGIQATPGKGPRAQ